MKLVCMHTNMAVENIENHFTSKNIPYERVFIAPILPERNSKLEQYKRQKVFERIFANMSHLANERILTAMGHGMFHHYTSGLLEIIADSQSKAYTYIHIDNHPDNQHRYSKLIDCGHFVHPKMAKNLKYIVGIGPRSKRWNKEVFDISFQGGPTKNKYPISTLKSILNEIPTEDVYVSCDLDILNWFEMSTEPKWGNGDMSLSKLVEIIQTIDNQKNIISADKIGYHTQFGSLPIIKDASLLVYETLYHAFNRNPTEELISEHIKLATRISWRAK